MPAAAGGVNRLIKLVYRDCVRAYQHRQPAVSFSSRRLPIYLPSVVTLCYHDLLTKIIHLIRYPIQYEKISIFYPIWIVSLIVQILRSCGRRCM
jgi:hypothetical protein